MHLVIYIFFFGCSLLLYVYEDFVKINILLNLMYFFFNFFCAYKLVLILHIDPNSDLHYCERAGGDQNCIRDICIKVGQRNVII